MDMKISVVIPAYNAGKHIARCLRSVFSQKLNPYEVIVVDDGSTDETEEIIKDLSFEVIYINQENSGPSSARNKGIKHATGSYIALLDSDDMWENDHLLNAQMLLEEYPESKWYCCAYDVLKNNEIIKKNLIEKRGKVDYFENSIKKTFVHTSTLIICKTVFDEIGLFEEKWKYGEDLNLWFRIASLYPTILYSGKISSHFIITKYSLTYDKSDYDLMNSYNVIESTILQKKTVSNKYKKAYCELWVKSLLKNSLKRNRRDVFNKTYNNLLKFVNPIDKFFFKCVNFKIVFMCFDLAYRVRKMVKDVRS